MKLSRISLLIGSLLITPEVLSMEWHTITLTINQIEPQRGGEIVVYIFLKEGFPIKHGKALKKYPFDPHHITHTIEIEVPNVPFAIKAHHDEDRSGTVTKNWTRIIPAEGFSFSSGAKMNVGPPTFKDAMLDKPDNNKIHLPMIYP